jgi:hypothetical protein
VITSLTLKTESPDIIVLNLKPETKDPKKVWWLDVGLESVMRSRADIGERGSAGAYTTAVIAISGQYCGAVA